MGLFVSSKTLRQLHAGTGSSTGVVSGDGSAIGIVSGIGSSTRRVISFPKSPMV
jgi:hypothetical protein